MHTQSFHRQCKIWVVTLESSLSNLPWNSQMSTKLTGLQPLHRLPKLNQPNHRHSSLAAACSMANSTKVNLMLDSLKLLKLSVEIRLNPLKNRLNLYASKAKMISPPQRSSHWLASVVMKSMLTVCLNLLPSLTVAPNLMRRCKILSSAQKTPVGSATNSSLVPLRLSVRSLRR